MNNYELEEMENEVIYKDEMSNRALLFLFLMCMIPFVVGGLIIIIKSI